MVENAYKCCASTSIRAGAEKENHWEKKFQNYFWVMWYEKISLGNK